MRLRLWCVPMGALGLVVAAACSSSSSSSPNKTPGQCVLQSGIWYCGTGYGDYADCNAIEGGYGACSPGDGGSCFSCSQAGETCSCGRNTDAGAPWVWQCFPTGTGCATF